jgi:hypothetical protein
VVYLTERGERLAAIVPAEFAEALEGMSEADSRELLEDLADAAGSPAALTVLAGAQRPGAGTGAGSLAQRARVTSGRPRSATPDRARTGERKQAPRT